MEKAGSQEWDSEQRDGGVDEVRLNRKNVALRAKQRYVYFKQGFTKKSVKFLNWIVA